MSDLNGDRLNCQLEESEESDLEGIIYRGQDIYLDEAQSNSFIVIEDDQDGQDDHDDQENQEDQDDQDTKSDFEAMEEQSSDVEADLNMDPTPIDQAFFSHGQHTDSVYAVSFSTFNTSNASSSNPEESKCNPEEIYPFCFASGGGDDLGYLWSSSDLSKPLYQLSGHTDSIVAISFDRCNAGLLATASMDSTIKIWRTSSGELCNTLQGPTESIESIHWHPKGAFLVAGSLDGTIWMWNVQKEKPVQVFSGHWASVNQVAFTNDATRLVSISSDTSLKTWSPKTGNCLTTTQGYPFHSGEITCLAISDNDQMAVTGGQDNLICLTLLQSGKVKGQLSGHEDSVEFVEWFQEKNWVISASSDGYLGVWDLQTLTKRQMIKSSSGCITGLKRVDSTVYITDSEGYIKQWDVRIGTNIWTKRIHQDPILSLDIIRGRERNLILTGSDDKTIKIIAQEKVSNKDAFFNNV